MGGILILQGKIVKYFTEPITQEDCDRFAAKLNDPTFISVWEALAILVALRLWLARSPSLTRFEIKSDSLAALKALEKGSSRSKPLNAVIREISLMEALHGSSFMVTRHIPGVANSVPDALSRLAAPAPPQFPESLRDAALDKSPPRDEKFWVTCGERARAQ